MKILDTRIRPPYKSFKAGFFDSTATLDKVQFAKDLAENRFGMTIAESLIEGSMELLLQEMDEAGIVKAISPMRDFGGIGNNQDVIDLMEDYPSRFIGVPIVDIYYGKKRNYEIMEKYIINGPCCALMIEPGFSEQPMYADDHHFYYIYELCQENNIPLMMAFGGFIGPDYSYCNPLLIDHIATDFPNLKILLAHGGYPSVTEMCHVASNHQNIWLAPDLYMMNAPGWREYLDAANCMLRKRICYGSAYPLVDAKAAVKHYLNMGFKESVLEDIMYNNAATFLGLNN